MKFFGFLKVAFFTLFFLMVSAVCTIAQVNNNKILILFIMWLVVIGYPAYVLSLIAMIIRHTEVRPVSMTSFVSMFICGLSLWIAMYVYLANSGLTPSKFEVYGWVFELILLFVNAAMIFISGQEAKSAKVRA